MTKNTHSNNCITIAVSSCLLGHKIRYDGKDKYNDRIAKDICNQFTCVPICPEYAIGLGVPRTPIQLVRIGRNTKVLDGENKSLEVNKALVNYANFISESFKYMCGYIFKARSPSCGLYDTPVFDGKGQAIAKGRGAYARQIIRMNTSLPVIDEIQLEDTHLRKEFIRGVEDYYHSIPQ